MSDGLLSAETPAETRFFESGGAEAPPAEAPVVEGSQPSQPEGGTGDKPQQAVKPEADKPKPGYVPHQALHEERAKRRQLEQELAEFRAFKAQIEAEKNKPKPPEVPDLAADPVGHFKARTDLTTQELTELRQWKAKTEEERGKSEAENRFKMVIAGHEREFVKTAPDYLDAMEYIRNRRDSDLSLYGMTDAAQRAQVIQNEAMGLAWNAVQAGESPAERAYNLAKAWGYKPKGQKADEKIETLQKGADAASRLSGKGAPHANNISPEDLLGMDDDEFDKAWNKVMGGKK